jgi:hypothetical protein
VQARLLPRDHRETHDPGFFLAISIIPARLRLRPCLPPPPAPPTALLPPVTEAAAPHRSTTHHWSTAVGDKSPNSPQTLILTELLFEATAPSHRLTPPAQPCAPSPLLRLLPPSQSEGSPPKSKSRWGHGLPSHRRGARRLSVSQLQTQTIFPVVNEMSH